MAYSSEQDFQVLTGKLARSASWGFPVMPFFLMTCRRICRTRRTAPVQDPGAGAHLPDQPALPTPQGAISLESPDPDADDLHQRVGNPDYLKELGAGVDPGVSIVWTGPKTLSPAITAEQAREWGTYIHRPPLIWDNFPVNDGAQWCRYLGRSTGRDASSAREVTRGLFANPIIAPHASIIPLQTVADYLWNARAYDPAQSEAHAVRKPIRRRRAAPARALPKTYGTYFWEDGNFTPLFKERHYPIDVATMQAQLAEMNQALERLRYQHRPEPLLKEIAPALTPPPSAGRRTRLTRRSATCPTARGNGTRTTRPLPPTIWPSAPIAMARLYQVGEWPPHRLDDVAQVVEGARHRRAPMILSAAWPWPGMRAFSTWALTSATPISTSLSSRAAFRTATRW